MAKRRQAAVRRTKSKAAKKRTGPGKRPISRATGKKSRKTTKKVAAKPSRKRVKRARRQAAQTAPVVEREIIDVVDEPVPGVVRVTEIEATSVAAPVSDDDNEA